MPSHPHSHCRDRVDARQRHEADPAVSPARDARLRGHSRRPGAAGDAADARRRAADAARRPPRDDGPRSGSEPAFEALFDRHHRTVLAFCRHMVGSAEEAEDAVQHTFLAAYRQLRDSREPIHLRPWLYTVARNRCLSVLRARRERPMEEADEPSTDNLAAEVQRREDLRELLRDLSTLPDDQRAALVLAELGAASHEEIGRDPRLPAHEGEGAGLPGPLHAGRHPPGPRHSLRGDPRAARAAALELHAPHDAQPARPGVRRLPRVPRPGPRPAALAGRLPAGAARPRAAGQPVGGHLRRDGRGRRRRVRRRRARRRQGARRASRWPAGAPRRAWRPSARRSSPRRARPDRRGRASGGRHRTVHATGAGSRRADHRARARLRGGAGPRPGRCGTGRDGDPAGGEPCARRALAADDPAGALARGHAPRRAQRHARSPPPR